MNSLRLTGKLIVYTLCVLLMLVALALAGARVAVFYVHDYKEQIAAIAGSYLGSPVQIDDIELIWNRFDARATLTGVRVKSSNGARTKLVLPRVDLRLNARDIILQRKLTVRNVTLRGLSLVAAYEGSGRLSVLGYGRSNKPRLGVDGQVVKPVESQGASALAWLFNARSIAILDSEILLHDAARGARYKLDKLNIRAYNDGDQHKIRVSSSLPNMLGDVSVAAFDFTGDASGIGNWIGQFYINGTGLDLQQFSRFVNLGHYRVAGNADVQVWGGWTGTRLTQARAVIAGQSVAVKALDPHQAETKLAEIGGKVDVDMQWRRIPTGWEASFNRLAVSLADGEFDLTGLDVHSEKKRGGQRELYIAGPDIDLVSSSSVRQFVKAILPASGARIVTAVQGGQLRGWLLGAAFTKNGLALRAMVAKVSRLHTVPTGKIPGVNSLTGTVFFREGVGRVVLERQQVELAIDEVLGNPLPPLSVQGTFRYAAGHGNWNLSSNDLRLETTDIATLTSLSVGRSESGELPMLINTHLLGGNLQVASTYLPRAFIKPDLYQWLRYALVDGELVSGELTLDGQLGRYAPTKGLGTLDARLEVQKAIIRYKKGWPPVEDVAASLIFDESSLSATVHRAEMRDAVIEQAQFEVQDYREPILNLQSTARGPVADFLDFLQNGPLVEDVGQFMGNAVGSGESLVRLDLEIPLRGPLDDRLVTNGYFTLDNSRIEARDYGLTLDNVSGKVGFTRAGVDIDDLAARYLGLPVRINAVRRVKGGQQVNSLFVHGPVAISSILHSYGIKLPESFRGISHWQVQLDVAKREGRETLVTLQATSDLHGTELLLPAPLSKARNVRLPVSVKTAFTGVDLDWWIRLPDLLEARIRVDQQRQVESMAFALGGSSNTVLPWRGMAINGNVDSLEALKWVQYALLMAEQTESSDASDEPFPLFANVTAKQALIGQELLGEMQYTAFRDGTHQVHRVENRYVSGELLERKSAEKTEPLLLQLSLLDRVLLAAIGEAESASTQEDSAALDPREIPPLDITVKKLIWDNWRFSRVSVRTRPEQYGMEITGLSARHSSMRVSGNGRWKVTTKLATNDDSHVSAIDLTATFDDVGQAVDELGGGQTLGRGTGEVALSLRWPSPLYSPELPQLEGQLFFNLRDGRILTVDPGAGRILGLFALQALPRRLTLDFRDLYKSGLEYSSVNGNFSISNGVASTQSLRLIGPVAEILVRGETDFVNQQYDQTIDVLPRVSAALPIIGILSGGPAVGVTAYVADEILKGVGFNLDEVGRRQYVLDGDWAEPRWESVAAPPAAQRGFQPKEEGRAGK